VGSNGKQFVKDVARHAASETIYHLVKPYTVDTIEGPESKALASAVAGAAISYAVTGGFKIILT
jgi:hypothetical protein